MTTRDEARAFFDSIAGRYDRVYAPPRDESRARNARVLAELAPRSRVLDLGVGTGRELSALMDAGHVVTGLDLSPEMLARCARRSRPIPLIQADLWDPLPFEAGSFDAVVALHGTLAHPPSNSAPRALGVEVSRVLARTGVFVLEVPLPAWIARHTVDSERRIVRVSDTRARVTDTTTDTTIETLLLSSDDWRAALSPPLTITSAIEDGPELFLVAAQLAPAR